MISRKDFAGRPGPMGGIKRVCNIDGLMQIFSFACLSSIFLAAGLLGFHNLVAEGFIIAACSAFIWHRRKRWPESQWVDFRHWPRRIAMWAVLAAGVGVTWWLTRRFSPPTRAPAIPIVVIIILLQAVLPTSRNLPGSIIRPRQLIRNNYTIGLLAGLLFSVAIGFLLGSTTDLIKSAGGFSVLVVISGLGGILAALFIAPLWTRYVAFLLTTRGRVPWTLGRFLDWAANVGLMRMAGTAYQFRHRELQEHLASEFFIKDKPLASTADAQGPSRLSRFAAALAFVAVWAAGIGSINYLGNNTSLRDLQMGTATTDLQPTFNRLNVAAEKHDEVKFLNFVAPALQPRVRLWWENLRRLGLIVSTVYDEAGDGYPPPAAVNSHGNAVQDMGVIAHTGNVANTFTVGSYRIMVHQLPTSKAGQITSWQPLSPAPWDAPVKLYVRNASRVVIATYPDEHAAADAEFSSAVTAANFELSLRSFFPLRQDQFFVFLSENPARRRFSQVASSTPRQTAISNSLADTPSYLSIFPPAYAMADPAFAVGDPISWVISAPPSRSRATIEMISAFSLVGVGPSLVSDDSIPDWVTVGYGRFAEALYLSGTKPSSYSFTWLEKQLAMLPPRMLESRLPTDAELTRGSAAEIAQWSDVAASVYAYISARWGLTSSLNTILGETEGPPAASPLELIQDGSKSSGEAENDWEQWLRSYRR